MRKHWAVGVSRDGWSVHVTEEPRWAQLAESAWNVLCTMTGGWAGGHGMPGWP